MRSFDPIILYCRKCGNTMTYERSIDPNIPTEVVRIESNLCDRCDDGGGFGEETWFDAQNHEVVP